MKRKPLLLIAFLLIAVAANAQSKKELEKSLNAANAEKDSIQKAYNALVAATDSINKAKLETDSLNQIAIEKEAVVKSDTSVTISVSDSTSKVVATGSDTTKKAVVTTTTPATAPPKPAAYQGEDLRTENERLKYIINQYFGKGTIPAKAEDLDGLWVLSLQYFKVTDDSSKSGLINVPAPPESRNAVRVIFIDFELAEITYSTGETAKCFYKVNSFSNTQPYSIDFTKGPELNVRLQVNPTSGGELQVSYKKGVGYYSGFMRKIL